METSLLLGGHHPRFLIVDAPKQQALHAQDLAAFVTRFDALSKKHRNAVRLVMGATDPAIIPSGRADAIWEPDRPPKERVADASSRTCSFGSLDGADSSALRALQSERATHHRFDHALLVHYQARSRTEGARRRRVLAHLQLGVARRRRFFGSARHPFDDPRTRISRRRRRRVRLAACVEREPANGIRVEDAAHIVALGGSLRVERREVEQRVV